MVAVAEARPPYVEFVLRPVENRAKSLDAGHPVFDDQVFALITPMGSKDRMERPAEDWINYLREQARQERFPQHWADHFATKLASFQAGLEMAQEGTDLSQWAGATPGQVATLKAAKLFTVEDLAAANEEALRQIGMGGRELRERARSWLETSANVGVVAEQNNALKVEIEQLKAQLVAQTAKTEELRGQVVALQSAAASKK